jgi:putative methyltransferase (TIGR04325 family)
MFRQLLRDLTPPIAVDLLRGGRLYSSWASAKAAAQGYASVELNRFKAARALGRRPDGTLVRRSALGLVTAAIGRDDCRVTDLGGSAGELGEDFLIECPQARYVVVENPTLVEAMKERERLSFDVTIPGDCDIFFSSGTLQYLDDPVAAIDRGFASARHAVVLVRNSFSEAAIYRVQRTRLFDNGSGPIPAGFADATIAYPHRTIAESSIHAAADRYGFRCVTSIAELDGVLPYRSQVYSRQLVFLKDKAR